MQLPSQIGVSTRFDNDAGVAEFRSFTNIVDVTADYYPADNISADRVDHENSQAADDASWVTTANTSATKSQITSIVESNNDLSGQATIGELVTYTVGVTVPAHTTVYDGVLSDPMPTGLSFVSATGVAVPAGGSVDPANGTLTFPPTYQNSTGSSETFLVEIVARVTTLGIQHPGHGRTNTASFRSSLQHRAARRSPRPHRQHDGAHRRAQPVDREVGEPDRRHRRPDRHLPARRVERERPARRRTTPSSSTACPPGSPSARSPPHRSARRRPSRPGTGPGARRQRLRGRHHPDPLGDRHRGRRHPEPQGAHLHGHRRPGRRRRPAVHQPRDAHRLHAGRRHAHPEPERADLHPHRAGDRHRRRPGHHQGRDPDAGHHRRGPGLHRHRPRARERQLPADLLRRHAAGGCVDHAVEHVRGVHRRGHRRVVRAAADALAAADVRPAGGAVRRRPDRRRPTNGSSPCATPSRSSTSRQRRRERR